MVKGLEIFRKYFKDYQNQYVLIGGAACDIYFQKSNASFRATRDLDMVLVMDALTKEFGGHFWQFIRDGGYQNRFKSNGNPQFYRFDKPLAEGFPYMIELFSRFEFSGLDQDASLIPVHIDDAVSSLSAILLDDAYYSMLLYGCEIIEDICVLKPTYLIPFKAKAWLDLKNRKEKGESVDSKNIKKHKNDIFRLASEMILEPNCKCSDIVKQDMKTFIEESQKEVIKLGDLKIDGVNSDEILNLLRNIYT